MNNSKSKTLQINRIKSPRLFLLILHSFLFSTTYYVEGNLGNDANDCSLNDPCKTIQVAIDKAIIDGDIIEVSAGIYIENVIIEKGITLRSADFNNPATIDGSSATGQIGSCINIREAASKGSSRGTVTVEGMILTGGKGTTVKIKGADGTYDPLDPTDKINVGGAIRSQNVNLVSKKKWPHAPPGTYPMNIFLNALI